MTRDLMDTSVQVRMVNEFKKDLRERAEKMGIAASTLARLIIEEAIKTESYKNIKIPEYILPNQERKPE